MNNDSTMDAVPIRADNVESKTDSQSLVQLRMTVPAKTGIGGYIGRCFGFRSHVRVNLDERGSAFWNLIDGKRSLKAIGGKLRRKFALSREDSETATIEFAKMLMKRYLIYLEVPAERERQRCQTM